LTYRLLHLADLHLDRAFAMTGCQADLARRRRSGLRDALRLVGETAQAEGCSAVTIGGDLYEHERAGVDTGRFLATLFASWRPVRVFLAPGNHDALLPGSLYRRTEWPDNVHVFAEAALAPVELEDGLALWGLAHREPAWLGNPLAGDHAPSEGVHLALFHGSELGTRPEGKAIHGPFRADQVREQGYRAGLCGHYHRRRVDEASGLIYPGTPEPLTFDESGVRGPVLVEIAGDGAVRPTPLSLNRWTVVTASCDVSDASSTTDVIDGATAACIAAGAASDAERTLIRLDLTGALDCAVSIDASSVEAEARDRSGTALVKIRDLTTQAVDLALLAEERSARGAFVRATTASLQAAGEDGERELLRETLRYGLEALAGAEVGLR
jgi:DNA repair protein SbcD/Mre11